MTSWASLSVRMTGARVSSASRNLRSPTRRSRRAAHLAIAAHAALKFDVHAVVDRMESDDSRDVAEYADIFADVSGSSSR